MIYPIILRYFLTNKKLSLPGIGNFTIEYVPAKINFFERKIISPYQLINFSEEVSKYDNNIQNYIAKELKIDELIANKELQELIDDIKLTLENKNFIKLPGIGSLRKMNDSLFLEASRRDIDLLDIHLDQEDVNGNNEATNKLVQLYEIGQSQIHTPELETDKLKKIVKKEKEDFWWMWVAIFVLIICTVLLYNFF